jgi:hypothetical protein
MVSHSSSVTSSLAMYSCYPLSGFVRLTKYRGKPRKYGCMWRASTVQGIVKRAAYSGTHTVNAHKEPIERKVPPIVEPGLQQKALACLEENRHFSGGRPHREYLLQCERCGALYSGGASTSNGYRYHYYSSQRNRATREKRLQTNNSCARVSGVA